MEAAGVEPASENTPLQASTCVFLLKCLSRLGSTRTRNFQRYPAFYFAFQASRHLLKAIPLIDAPINPAGTGWWNGSLFMLLQHMHSRLRLYLMFQPFNEQSETSTCSLSLYIPVESVSPPVYFFEFCVGKLFVGFSQPVHLPVGLFFLQGIPFVIEGFPFAQTKAEFCQPFSCKVNLYWY